MMFTFLDKDRPATGRSAARRFTRAALLAGVTAPLVFIAYARHAHEAPEPQPIAVVAATVTTGPLGDALAGMRYGLSAADLDRYRHAFSAVDNGDWRALAAWTSYVQDRRLIGHLLAQHYLAPDAAPTFADLRAWIDLYGDLPEADDIYRKAESEQPRDTTLPKPHAPEAGTSIAANAGQETSSEPHTAAGEHASSRFFASDNKTALSEASRAITTVGQKASTSHWIAGLASWRLGLFQEAGKHFTALANSSTAAGWMQAAGAYWAGRVEEHNGGSTANATKWFTAASRYPTTFYGMLAMRKLGVDVAQGVSAASLTSEHLDTLAETPAGYRAIALLELGQRDLAAQELERVDAGNPKLEAAVIMVADAAHLGDISPNLAQRIARPADDAVANFPIPRWQPRGGFRIDPALVYAVARQESRFDPKALSSAGAVGLMQIMPSTANAMAPRGNPSLLDPSTNMDIGQRFIRTLMQDPNIGENLLLLAVAYNRGPGNPSQLRQMLDHDDPLLAVESIPKDETRTFIEHVLANYWVYRARLGGDTSSLSDLADGRWPLYHWDNTPDGSDSLGIAQAAQRSD